LVNIVLNGLPKTWDAFVASMNTRKEYPTFEELWNCCAQEESRINAKEKPQMTIKPSQRDSRTSGTKGSLVQGGSQIKRKTFQKYNASIFESMVTTRIIVLS
jgi:hypothetical protein